MSLTVVIATRNNCGLLASTLASLSRIDVPTDRWQVVVADNGSTDDTEGVIKEFADALPLIGIKEPTPGKNRALNRAMPRVDGELTVFTDDDVIPDGDWLCRLWEAAQRFPDYAVFGGHIRGRWPGEANPQGLSAQLLAPLYSLTGPGMCEGPVSPELVWGPNMAVRTAVFEAGHRFDESVGPDGTDDYAMGSEITFLRHLAGCGYRARYVPAARVQHVIRPHQLDRPWILRRARRYGRCECRRDAQLGRLPQVTTLFGYPRWMLRRLLGLKLRRSWPGRWRRDARALEDDWEYFRLQGYVAEARALRKGERPRLS